MRTANHCQDRVLLLLQVAEECPRLRERAEFIASEWLLIAAIEIELASKWRHEIGFRCACNEAHG
jgi:hypothetical protein